MKRPTKAIIGNFPYKIKYKPVVKDPDSNDGKDLFGIFMYARQEIWISTNSIELRRKETIAHEVMHGISDHYGWNLSEGEVARAGIFIIDFFRKNKAYILSMLEGQEMKAKKISIAGHHYKIYYKKEISADNGDCFFARSDGTKEEIEINNSYTKEKTFLFLFNQVLHFILFSMGYNLSADREEGMTQILYDFMMNNKNLIRYLCEVK